MVAGHWQFLDSADAMVTFSAEMSEFRKTGVPTETPAFPNSFVKETPFKPGGALIAFSIPAPGVQAHNWSVHHRGSPGRSVMQQAVAHGPDHDLLLRVKPQLSLYVVDGVSDGNRLDSPCLRNRRV